MAAAAGSGPPESITNASRYKHPYLCAAGYSGATPRLTIGYWCPRSDRYKTIKPEYTMERIDTNILNKFFQLERIVEGEDKYHVVTPEGEPPAISQQKYEVRVDVAHMIVQRTLNFRFYGNPDRYPTTDDESHESEPHDNAQHSAEEEEPQEAATDEGTSDQGTAPQERGSQDTTLLTAPLAVACDEAGGSGLVPNESMKPEGTRGNKVQRNKVKETAKRAQSGLTGNGPDSDEEGDESVEAHEDEETPVSKPTNDHGQSIQAAPSQTATPPIGPTHLGSASHPIPIDTPPKLVGGKSTAVGLIAQLTPKETKGGDHLAARLSGRFNEATSSNPPPVTIAGKRASFEACLGGSLEVQKPNKVHKRPINQEREQLDNKAGASSKGKSSIDHPATAPMQGLVEPKRRLDPAYLLNSRIRDMRELLRHKPMLCAHCENAGSEDWLTAQPGVYYVDDTGTVLCSNFMPATESVPEQGCIKFRPSLENLRSLWINEFGQPNLSSF